MDHRLEPIDKLLPGLKDLENTETELDFALSLLDRRDPASLRWLAACAAVRADELDEA